MRARSVMAIGLLLLPALSEAQRPRFGGRRVGQAGLSGPQPRVVQQAIAYNRMRAAFESYPMLTMFDAPGFNGPGDYGWTAGGQGMRVEYRVHRLAAITMDATSSFIGNPIFVQTLELGTRLGPRRFEHGVVPFFDARVGYIYANSNNIGLNSSSPVPRDAFVSGARYSDGFGGVVGAGLETAITRRFSLVTGYHFQRSRMVSHALDNLSSAPGSDQRFMMNGYRWTISLRYNGIRYIDDPRNR
jgi:hypothetical protein